jgi:hypothetical protein
MRESASIGPKSAAKGSDKNFLLWILQKCAIVTPYGYLKEKRILPSSS